MSRESSADQPRYLVVDREGCFYAVPGDILDRYAIEAQDLQGAVEAWERGAEDEDDEERERSRIRDPSAPRRSPPWGPPRRRGSWQEPGSWVF